MSAQAAQPAFVLCAGFYRAIQYGPSVVLFASGILPCAGDEVVFQQTATDKFPPAFALYRRFSRGVARDVATPFSIARHFQAPAAIHSIRVLDAAGAHDVAVEQANSGVM